MRSFDMPVRELPKQAPFKPLVGPLTPTPNKTMADFVICYCEDCDNERLLRENS